MRPPTLTRLHEELLREVMSYLSSPNDLCSLVLSCKHMAMVFKASTRTILIRYLERNLSPLAIETGSIIFDLRWHLQQQKSLETFLQEAEISGFGMELRQKGDEYLRFLFQLCLRHEALAEATLDLMPLTLDPSEWTTVTRDANQKILGGGHAWVDQFLKRLIPTCELTIRSELKPRVLSSLFFFDLFVHMRGGHHNHIPVNFADKQRFLDLLALSRPIDLQDPDQPISLKYAHPGFEREESVLKDMALVSWIFLTCRWNLPDGKKPKVLPERYERYMKLVNDLLPGAMHLDPTFHYPGYLERTKDQPNNLRTFFWISSHWNLTYHYAVDGEWLYDTTVDGPILGSGWFEARYPTPHKMFINPPRIPWTQRP